MLHLKKSYLRQFEERRKFAITGKSLIDIQIQQKEEEQQRLIKKIDILENHLIIKSVEEKVGKLENELGLLYAARNKQEKDKANAQDAINCFWYYLEHLDELILQKDNPTQSAKLFSLIFQEKPTYEELSVGTPRLASIFNLNDASKDNSEPDIGTIELILQEYQGYYQELRQYVQVWN